MDTPTRSRIRYNQTHQVPEQPIPVIDITEGKDLSQRQMPEIPQPSPVPPTPEQFFSPTNPNDIGRSAKPNANFLRDHFFREGRLTEEQALFILEEATNVLSRESNLVKIKSPVIICGDIHGQYYDLMKLFEVGGNLDNDNSYLFLGDYVDRGHFGIECLLYLYTLKLWHPTKFILLRGNHECQHLTEFFTFKRECLHKYSPAVYAACVRSFQALPLAALVDERFFCVHGGISPLLVKLQDLDEINRFTEPGSSGLLCDLLWSDPIAHFGHEQEYGVPPGTMWLKNEARGCSWFYTYEGVCLFLETNGLLGIIRGHEAQDAGYTMHRKTPTKKFPSVITIFSAPNYLDMYHNRGAVLKYADKNITIRQYNNSPHPFWLPNFMDAFTWSLPFMGAKIAEMLLAILSICSEEELDTDSSSEDEAAAGGEKKEKELHERRQDIKNKILAVGRMQRVFAMLRDEAESASELEIQGGITPTVRPPSSADANNMELSAHELNVQANQIRRSIRNFQDARASDLSNERLPEFIPEASPSVFPVPAPSMRRLSSHSPHSPHSPSTSTSADGEINMDMLIRKTLEEDNAQDGVVERLAERIARGRVATGKPTTKVLKRFETT